MPPRHPDAIIPPPEEIVVSTKRVACDGGGGALGQGLGDEGAAVGRRARQGDEQGAGRDLAAVGGHAGDDRIGRQVTAQQVGQVKRAHSPSPCTS